MKSIILAIIIVLVMFGGIYLIKNKSADEVLKPASESILSVNKKLYDFGDIDIFGGKVTTDFELKNEGNDDIVITEGTTSCGCTNAEIGGISFGMHEKMSNEFIIPAGETKNLKVIYDPLAHGPSGVGLAQRSVFLKTNSSVTPELEVRIKAMVIKSEE